MRLIKHVVNIFGQFESKVVRLFFIEVKFGSSLKIKKIFILNNFDFNKYLWKPLFLAI